MKPIAEVVHTYLSPGCYIDACANRTTREVAERLVTIAEDCIYRDYRPLIDLKVELEELNENEDEDLYRESIDGITLDLCDLLELACRPGHYLDWDAGTLCVTSEPRD